MGVVHGGVLCTIADTAMGAAYGATLGEGETFATLELKINFPRPVQHASLIAKATSTYMTQRPDRTTGA